MAASEQPRIESASQIVSPPHPVTPPRPPFNLPPIQLSASDEDWNEPEAHHRQPNFGFDLPARRQAYIPAVSRSHQYLVFRGLTDKSALHRTSAILQFSSTLISLLRIRNKTWQVFTSLSSRS